MRNPILISILLFSFITAVMGQEIPNNPSVNQSRLNSAVALLIILTILFSVLTVLFFFFYRKGESYLSTRLINSKHFLSSLPGRSILFFLQLVLFILLLAGMANDVWSTQSNARYGVVSVDSVGNRVYYADACSNINGISAKQCSTGRAAGAFTLIFGIGAILLCTVVLADLAFLLFRKTTQERYYFNVWLQSLCNMFITASTLIWALGAHLALSASNGSSLHLGPSWGLFLTSFILALILQLAHCFVYTLNDYTYNTLNFCQTSSQASTNPTTTTSPNDVHGINQFNNNV